MTSESTAGRPTQTAVNVAGKVARMLDDSFRQWCQGDWQRMASHVFHVVCVSDPGRCASFKICEAHLKACFLELHFMFRSIGVFETPPVPSELLAPYQHLYNAACFVIFQAMYPSSPHAADCDAALVAYASAVATYDITHLIDTVIILLTRRELMTEAATNGMHDMIELVKAAGFDYHELVRLGHIVRSTILERMERRRLVVTPMFAPSAS
jgi:hypothetical protein